MLGTLEDGKDLQRVMFEKSGEKEETDRGAWAHGEVDVIRTEQRRMRMSLQYPRRPTLAAVLLSHTSLFLGCQKSCAPVRAPVYLARCYQLYDSPYTIL